MSRIATVCLIVLNFSIAVGQTRTYKDVAVIININSAISDSIGNYFVKERHIPTQNRIFISAPTTEEIDSLQFQNLRTQIELYLITNHLQDSINYIVTTKGVPLKIKRSNLMAAASVESELTLILGPYSTYIQKPDRIVSPYYREREHFTHLRYGIYLVSRLDGYTYADVKKIIDQSSQIAQSIPTEARFVFDQDPSWNSSTPNLNKNMSTITNTFLSRGLSVKLDSTSTFLTREQNVLGYASWGSNDTKSSFHGLVNNSWMRGAIAETYVSTSGRTFNSPAVYGQSLIADLIKEGITAAKGYVYEPYSSAMANVNFLFDLYTSGYTVAESFYSASPYLSWMDVVVGDPKFRLISTRLPSDFVDDPSQKETNTLPVELVSFSSIVKNTIVKLQWRTATEINNARFEIERRSFNDNTEWENIGSVEGNGTSNTSKEYSFIDKLTHNGKYEYHLKQIDRNGAIEYSNSIMAIISIVSNSMLNQNFPNPFNPATKISFSLATTSNVKLIVYDITGKEIAMLVNGELPSGNHSIQFNAEHLPSGLYFYTLTGNNFSETKKMILMK